MEHSITFFEKWIPGVDHHNLFFVTSLFVMISLGVAALILFPRFKMIDQHIVPTKKIGLQSTFELLIEFLANMCDDVIGHGGRKYLPFVGTLFIFILCINLIGMIPGFLPPTETWVPGLALGLMSFVAFNYYGFKTNGLAYFKHLTAPISMEGIKNPILWILVLIPLLAFQMMFASIETISLVLRPITLAIRLNVNISADHTVLSIFSGLVPYLVPIPFMILGLFVCLRISF